MEGYSFSCGDFAHLPPSLTSLDLMIKPRAHEEINHKVVRGCSLGRLQNLRQFRVRKHGNEWKGLLAALARMSGLSDLEISGFYSSHMDNLSFSSGFGNLTRLSMSCDRGYAWLGPFSNLSGLKELQLVGGTAHVHANFGSVARLSSLSLLTSLTLKDFPAEDISWLTHPTLLAGLHSLECNAARFQCCSACPCCLL